MTGMATQEARCDACAARRPHTSDELAAYHPNAVRDCPGCMEFRLHKPDELNAFHPYAGHGYVHGQGWSHPDLGEVRGDLLPKRSA